MSGMMHSRTHVSYTVVTDQAPPPSLSWRPRAPQADRTQGSRFSAARAPGERARPAAHRFKTCERPGLLDVHRPVLGLLPGWEGEGEPKEGPGDQSRV